MPENEIISITKEKISQKAFDEKFKSKICTKGTLIMSFKLTVGRCSILDIDAVHNEAIISIEPIIDSNHIFRDYLAAILPLLTNYGESKDAIKGRTLNSSSLNNLLIPVPPLAEQKRIVELLNTLMQNIKRGGRFNRERIKNDTLVRIYKRHISLLFFLVVAAIHLQNLIFDILFVFYQISPLPRSTLCLYFVL